MPDETALDKWDALTAAPKHHTLKFENDAVRVLETIVPPGETVPPHTHCWPAVNVILSWAPFIRRDGEGNVTLDTQAQGFEVAEGETGWLEPLPIHTLENVGANPLRVVSIELKKATNSAADGWINDAEQA